MNQDSPNYISNDNNQGIDIGGDNSNRSNDDYSDDNNISNVCEDGEDCSGSNSEDINSYDDGCNNNKGDCEQGYDNSNNDTDDFVNDDLSLSSNSSDEDSDDVNDSFTDDFGEFLTSTDDADLVCGDDHDYFSNIDNISTTNAGEKAFTIRDANQVNNPNEVSGHVILNQCGSLLSRKDHEINGSSKHNFFLQKIHSTTDGLSIPLLYPESMLFPSIFPFQDPDGFLSLGCIPAPLLSRKMESLGFASIPQHTRTRLTVPFCKFSFTSIICCNLFFFY